MADNDVDIDLLRRDPHALVLKYQEMVRIIVKKYITTRMFTPADYDDVVQTVNVELLARIPSMQSHYNGSALVRTYISGVIRHVCIRIYKDRPRTSAASDFLLTLPDGERSVEDNFALAGEVYRFSAVLRMYGKKLPRLLLCLKLHFRLPLTPEDFTRAYPQSSKKDVVSLLRQLHGDGGDLRAYEVFNRVTPFINKYSGKSNTPDAIRKWTDIKLDEIIEIMNGFPPRAGFTEETIKFLLEDFFSPFLPRE